MNEDNSAECADRTPIMTQTTPTPGAGEFPQLPEPGYTSTQCDSTMRYTELRSFTADQMHAFAEATVALRAQGGQAGESGEALTVAITKADVLRVAKDIGLVGWISDCGSWFEFTETQHPSRLMIQFAEHYAALRAQAAPSSESPQ